MRFVEDHCFGCASALPDCVDENGYPTTHKIFTGLPGKINSNTALKKVQ